MVWKPKADPSPFVTKSATVVVRSVEELLKLFTEKGYIKAVASFEKREMPRQRGRHG